MARIKPSLILLAMLAIWSIACCGPCNCDGSRAQDRQARWARERANQEGRKRLIENLVAEHIFTKVDQRDTGATIWVGRAFYELSFKMKQDFCNVVYAYTATIAEDEFVNVTLKDDRSGKTVGTCDLWGLKLK